MAERSRSMFGFVCWPRWLRTNMYEEAGGLMVSPRNSVGKIWNKEFDQALIKQPHIARPVRAKIVGKYDEIFRCGSERSGSAWRAFDR